MTVMDLLLTEEARILFDQQKFKNDEQCKV
jgi:hypothetical protein